MIKTIYYRGNIDFCNYFCSYCPFSKKKEDSEKLKKDEKSLERLYDFIKNQEERVNLMITPYGEALFQELYQIYMARFSRLENINRVGIQTNLSVDLDKFEDILKNEDAKTEKIMLWATYHDQFAKMEDFSQKVNKCKLNISVGMVADTKNNSEIKKLRSMLKRDVYLWINAMDRRKNSFDFETIEDLARIDPMFFYEFNRFRIEEFEICNSYNNAYVDSDIYSSNCFFKKKKNIAENCNDHKKCDCYLGYSNFENSKLSNFFGENKAFRIPQKRKYKAMFIDFDGVLTDEMGDLISEIEDILQHLKSKTKLYLATARNMEFTRRELRSNFSYFSGGVFSDGAFNIDFEKKYIHINHINQKLEEKIYSKIAKANFEDSRFFTKDEINAKHFAKDKNYTVESRHKIEDMENVLLRFTIPTKIARNIKDEEIQNRNYGLRSYLQDENVTKLAGIKKFMEINNWTEEDVLFISDNLQDRDVFEYLKYTISAMEPEELSEFSHYRMNLNQSTLVIE